MLQYPYASTLVCKMREDALPATATSTQIALQLRLLLSCVAQCDVLEIVTGAADQSPLDAFGSEGAWGPFSCSAGFRQVAQQVVWQIVCLYDWCHIGDLAERPQ